MRVIMTDKIPITIDRHTDLRITTKNPKTKEYAYITGAALVFQAKLTLDTGATALFELKNATAGGNDSQISDYDLTSGIYDVHITPTNLTGLSIGGTYWGETKMTLAGKDITIFQRQIAIMPTAVD